MFIWQLRSPLAVDNMWNGVMNSKVFQIKSGTSERTHVTAYIEFRMQLKVPDWKSMQADAYTCTETQIQTHTLTHAQTHKKRIGVRRSFPFSREFMLLSWWKWNAYSQSTSLRCRCPWKSDKEAFVVKSHFIRESECVYLCLFRCVFASVFVSTSTLWL